MYRYVHSAPPQYHSNAQYENELIAKGLGRGHISPPTLSLHVYMNVRERGEVMYYNFPELRVSQNTETVQSLHNIPGKLAGKLAVQTILQ